MKIFSALVLIAISLCAGLCCPPEEDYNYQSIEVQNNNIINIENNENVFQLNDTIFINTLISNNQISVENENIISSDYVDLDSDPYLYYNLVLYKETDFGTLAKISITNDNLIIIDGLAENNYDEIIEVKNNFSDTNFTSKFGIKLLEIGTYYLASPNFNNTKSIFIYGNSIDNKYLTIISKIRNSDEDGAYKFTVE